MTENELSHAVIGAAIEVHRILGPGLLEGVYDDALCHELHLRGLSFQRQQRVPLRYKGVKLGTDLRYDLQVENKLLIEVKAKEALSLIDKPQLLTSPFARSSARFADKLPRALSQERHPSRRQPFAR